MSTVSNGTELVRQIRNAGVVGAGGAGFPTHVKIRNSSDLLIVNGAECEPLLESDTFLLETEAEKIIEAAVMISREIGASGIVVGIKKKNIHAVEAVSAAVSAADGRQRIEILLLDNIYPAGDEQVLVYEATGKIVPEGEIPLSVGVTVLNAETLFNIYQAVHDGLPVTERTVTCHGQVRRPGVIRTAVGTPLRDVLDACGGTVVDEPAFIIGGPVMGSVTYDPLTPVEKTMNGIIVLARDHPLITAKTLPLETILKRSRSVCCQCTLCTDLCPRHMLGHRIEPHLIMRMVNYGLDLPAGAVASALLCSECGVCEVFACPMGVSPAAVNRVIKERLALEGFTHDFSDLTPTPDPGRSGRMVPADRMITRLHLSGFQEKHVRRGVEVLPDMVELSLKQHIGQAARPVVQKGDAVEKGDIVAEAEAAEIGASVHASITGVVARVDEERIVIRTQKEVA